MSYSFYEKSAEKKIALIYTAYYGRAPDQAGYKFWNSYYSDSINDGTNEKDVILRVTNFFQDQDETRSNYPLFEDPQSANLTEVRDFLTEVYFNLFNRAPDTAGRDFWADIVQDRLAAKEPISDILIDIIIGAQGSDVATLDNKLSVAQYYVNQIDESQFNTAQATRTLLETTDDTSSVIQSRMNIDEIVANKGKNVDGNFSDKYMLVSDLDGNDIALVRHSDDEEKVVFNIPVAGQISDIAMTPQGDLLVSTFSKLYSYSISTGQTRELMTFDQSINAIETTADGTIYAAGPKTDNLYKVNLETKELEHVLDMPWSSAGDIAVNGNDLYIALMNDEVLKVELDTLKNEVVFEHELISDAYGIIASGDELFFGADKTIYRADNGDDVTELNTINIYKFEQISGATRVYEDMLDFI